MIVPKVGDILLEFCKREENEILIPESAKSYADMSARVVSLGQPNQEIKAGDFVIFDPSYLRLIGKGKYGVIKEDYILARIVGEGSKDIKGAAKTEIRRCPYCKSPHGDGNIMLSAGRCPLCGSDEYGHFPRDEVKVSEEERSLLTGIPEKHTPKGTFYSFPP